MNEEVWYFIGAVVLLVINYCMASKAGEIANDKGYDENLWKWSCLYSGGGNAGLEGTRHPEGNQQKPWAE